MTGRMSGLADPGADSSQGGTRSQASVTLVLRFAGTAIYPYTFDGRTLTILDAKYSVGSTPAALTGLTRYIRKLHRRTTASVVILVVPPHHLRPETQSAVAAIELTLQRDGIVVVTESVDRLQSKATVVIDRRLAWELVNILKGRRSDES